MKRPKTPNLVTVSILTTVTLIFWVFFSLYNILISIPEVNVSPEILEPLDPNLDASTLSILPQKIFIEEGDVEFTEDYIIQTEEPDIEPPEDVEESPSTPEEQTTTEEPTPTLVELEITEGV